MLQIKKINKKKLQGENVLGEKKQLFAMSQPQRNWGLWQKYGLISFYEKFIFLTVKVLLLLLEQNIKADHSCQKHFWKHKHLQYTLDIAVADATFLWLKTLNAFQLG